MAGDRLTIYLDTKTLIETNKKLANLSMIEREAVVAQAVKEGAQIISRQTRKNVIDFRLQNMYHYFDKKVIKIFKTFIRGGASNLYKSVSVLTRRKTGRSYAGFKRGKGGGSVAVFFEHGTKERYTKKGYYRGKVKAYELQKKSVDSKGDKALRTVLASVEKSIKRIMDRK